MFIISIFQLVVCSLVITEQVYAQENPKNVWWFRITRARSPFKTAEPTCLLRGQPAVTRDDYTYKPGIGAYKVHPIASTWHEGRRTCEDEGGHLAILNSIAEANFVSKLWNATGKVFGAVGVGEFASIGFHDLFVEGEYLTIHGQSLAKAGFTRWNVFQPDNKNGNEDCGSLSKFGGLNDSPCDRRIAFICELPV